MKNFKNIGVTLSRNEMRNVAGGLTDAGGLLDDGKAGCCYLQTNRLPLCGHTINEVKAMYQLTLNGGLTNAGWCCASC